VKKPKLKHLLYIFLAFIVATLIIDFIRILAYKIIPARPSENIKLFENQVQWDLANGKSIKDWNRLDPTLEYIKGEYDCSDFRLVNLIRRMSVP